MVPINLDVQGETVEQDRVRCAMFLEMHFFLRNLMNKLAGISRTIHTECSAIIAWTNPRPDNVRWLKQEHVKTCLNKLKLWHLLAIFGSVYIAIIASEYSQSTEAHCGFHSWTVEPDLIWQACGEKKYDFWLELYRQAVRKKKSCVDFRISRKLEMLQRRFFQLSLAVCLCIFFCMGNPHLYRL